MNFKNKNQLQIIEYFNNMINSLKYNDKYIVFFNFEKNTTNVNFYMHTCNQFEKKLSCKIKMYI